MSEVILSLRIIIASATVTAGLKPVTILERFAAEKLNGSISPGAAEGKVDDTGKGPEEVSLPGQLSHSKKITCYCVDRQEKEATGKDGDRGNVV